MRDIDAIYYNDFGIAFHWKKEPKNYRSKIQVVFRDTGFLLTQKELLRFAEHIQSTMNSNAVCNCCPKKKSCRALLLETPVPQVSLAVSVNELTAINDLIEGTIFQLNIDDFLSDICNN
ncbi:MULTISPECIES: hypothetical protein [unclassified Cellulophaga]|uniref:hypothetical protein n=1 Tax=unclassified Cellulophaga TaxID=2634405 RepID=UPI0026E409A4|nr:MULTISPECIES: hypothetical protein [unclassified Cellulophaga]MDO6491244.1 hypothetical protein [Cellulophaga sp. 2_MG-2023]MDO6495223.1 hypothetical protein [Cellulophaga sp. 3_MG-2023]